MILNRIVTRIDGAENEAEQTMQQIALLSSKEHENASDKKSPAHDQPMIIGVQRGESCLSHTARLKTTGEGRRPRPETAPHSRTIVSGGGLRVTMSWSKFIDTL